MSCTLWMNIPGINVSRKVIWFSVCFLHPILLFYYSCRWLLRTDMGSFIKEYFQVLIGNCIPSTRSKTRSYFFVPCCLKNQILNEGLSVILDEIQEYEGQVQSLYLCPSSNKHPKTVWVFCFFRGKTTSCFGWGVGQIFFGNSPNHTGNSLSSTGKSGWGWRSDFSLIQI